MPDTSKKQISQMIKLRRNKLLRGAVDVNRAFSGRSNESPETKLVNGDSSTTRPSDAIKPKLHDVSAYSRDFRILGSPKLPLVDTVPFDVPFPTLFPVQRCVIPYILEKVSISVISQTGSGKTLSFVLPYNYLLSNSEDTLLVVVPTRELITQIRCEFAKYGNLTVVELTGNKSIELQRIQINRGYNVLIGTPGRVRELIDLKAVNCVDYLIIDEADKVLGDDYREDVEVILDLCKSSVLSLFSATEFCYKTQCRIVVGSIGVNKNVRENFLHCQNKLEALKGVLRDNLGKTIVFCNTIKACEYLHRNVKSLVVHGKMAVEEREMVFGTLKSGVVLISTDLYGRGLDICDVDLVVNYDFPLSIEGYIHRCGRSGRLKEGKAISLLTDKDKPLFRRIRSMLERNNIAIPGFMQRKEEYILD